MPHIELLLIYIALGLSSAINIIVPISGSAIITPLLALLTDPHRAIGIASFFFVLGGVVRIYIFRKNIQWKEVRILLLPSIITAILGALAIINIPEQILLVIIFLFSIYFLLKKLGFIPKRKPSFRILNYLVGPLSGFLQGMGLAGSDLRNQYLYAQNLSILQVHGTTSLIGTLNFFVATIARLSTDQLALSDINKLLYLLPIIILATLAGKHVLYKISSKTSNRIVLFVMSIVVLSLAYKIFL